MGVFLYYIPGVETIDPAGIESAGLGRVFDGIDPVRGIVKERGPDDGAGLLLAAAGQIRQNVQYKPDSQTWIRPDGAAYWVGMDSRFPIAPEDLRREIVIGAADVELLDGNMWRVPTARMPSEACVLPQRYALGPDGKMVKDVSPEYAKLWELSDVAWRACESEEVEDEDRIDICVESIATNYRVGRSEVLLAGLLDDRRINLILWILVDRFHWEEGEEKKTEPDG